MLRGCSFTLGKIVYVELIANNDKEYQNNHETIEQRELLKKLKDKLRIQKEKNKIYDSEFFVKDLEKLYLSINN